MADETKQAWAKVGERFGAVGKHLTDKYKEGGSSDEAAAKEAEHTLEAIAKELMDKLERAVDAVDGTVRDQQARTDLKAALNALGDAITTTAHDVGTAVKGGGDDEPPRPDDAAPKGDGTA